MLSNIDEVDTPALVVYRHRLAANIDMAISMAGGRLRPHVKTSKSPDAVKLMKEKGIRKFKCATIAEAEMLGNCGSPDVLLAYQPVGPKLHRYLALIKKFPATVFSCIVDNEAAAQLVSKAAEKNSLRLNVYIDINVGMDRTGIAPARAAELFVACGRMKGINPLGLHAYDGHLRMPDITERTLACDQAFRYVEGVAETLQQQGFAPTIIAGGSPTFPIHAKRKEAECSPGTFVYWDRTYQSYCPEQDFEPAALVIARIISLPSETKICIDLGHKSIASEGELSKRVHFLNAPGLTFTSHSEEHLVASVPAGHAWKVGDVLYGLPWHICPTVALYERALVAEEGAITTEWRTVARDRKITV